MGSEVRKTRPAVIVSNDAANRNLARFVVVPLTSNVGRLPGQRAESKSSPQAALVIEGIEEEPGKRQDLTLTLR